ncbi:MAG: hypothetical protein SV253_04220 [Halobacteria archaeon]|nr:hypothetical protein [Halobacteria archaeon]
MLDLASILGFLKDSSSESRDYYSPHSSEVLDEATEGLDISTSEADRLLQTFEEAVLTDSVLSDLRDRAAGDGDSSGFIYIADESQRYLVIGGASRLYDGLSEEVLSEDDIEVIRRIYDVAASKNGDGEDTALEDVIFVEK